MSSSKISLAFQKVKGAYSLDLRALGLLRIGLGLTLLLDAVLRLSDLEAHYSNQGILPLEALFKYMWNDNYFSIFTISGNKFIILFLFIIYILSAIFLTVGLKVRWATFICYLFILSIHNRNPLIHQAGDDLMRLILFIGFFLPWDKRYALDESNYENLHFSNRSFSIAGLAYILQVAYVYFFSALLKTSPEWTSDFTALYYSLSLDQIALPVGKLIYPYYDLLKFLTAAVFYIELYLPFLLFVPIFNYVFRMTFILVVLGLHIGITLCLNVGLFPVIGIVSLLGLIPTEVMDVIGEKFKILNRRDHTHVKYFQEKFLVSIFAIIFIFYSISWNLETVGKKTTIRDLGLYFPAHFLRIDQQWGMFAPAVFKDDGWFVFVGQTKNGREINLDGSDSINYLTPSYRSGPFYKDRWRKYSENILLVNNSHFRTYFNSYLLNSWNEAASQDKKVDKVQMIYMKEVSLPNYEKSLPKKELLAEVSIVK